MIEVHRDWSPNGADRFYNLVKSGYFDGVKFFRVMPGFMVQFGMHGDPAVQAAWTSARIQDDPVKESNKRGYVTFAKPNAPNAAVHPGLHQLRRQREPRQATASPRSAR